MPLYASYLFIEDEVFNIFCALLIHRILRDLTLYLIPCMDHGGMISAAEELPDTGEWDFGENCRHEVHRHLARFDELFRFLFSANIRLFDPEIFAGDLDDLRDIDVGGLI